MRSAEEIKREIEQLSARMNQLRVEAIRAMIEEGGVSGMEATVWLVRTGLDRLDAQELIAGCILDRRRERAGG